MKTFLIDASLLKETDCLRKVDYIHNQGLTTTEDTFKMDYGTAFHKYKAAVDSGKGHLVGLNDAIQYYSEKCIYVPPGDFRTIDHLIKTCGAYHNYYTLYNDDYETEITPTGFHACELGFCFPVSNIFLCEKLWNLGITSSDSPVSNFLVEGNIELALVGTVDRKAKNRITGERCFIDTKVTAVYDKEKFLTGYELDPQLLFYSYVQKMSGLEDTFLPAMIDGVFIKKESATTKDKTTGKMVKVTEFNGVSFQRSELFYFSASQLEEFERFLWGKIYSILEAEYNKLYYPNFNRCKTLYGGCQFSALCKSPYNLREDLLNSSNAYTKRIYDPLRFQE